MKELPVNVDDFLETLSELIQDHKYEMLQKLFTVTNTHSLEELEAWDRSHFSCCGLCYLVPLDSEVSKQWKKQCGSTKIFLRLPYATQSIQLQEIQAGVVVELVNEKFEGSFILNSYID